MGLANGELPCCSTVGIITDKAVADADLMTLLLGRATRLSMSPLCCCCCCRARLRTRSLVARGDRLSVVTVSLPTSSLVTRPVTRVVGVPAGVDSSFLVLPALLAAAAAAADAMMAGAPPSSEAPRGLVMSGSASPSSGEERRCMSIRAEKRRLAPNGGLDSFSENSASVHDRRFISGEAARQLFSRRLKLPTLSLFVILSSRRPLRSLRVTVGALGSIWLRCSILL